MRNRATGCAVAVVCILGAVSTAAGAPPVLTPGKWQITLHTVKPHESPPAVTTLCVAPGRPPLLDVPVTKPSDDCKVSASTVAADRLKYSVACANAGTVMNADIAVEDDSFRGTFTVSSPAGDDVQTIEARRLGPCDSNN